MVHDALHDLPLRGLDVLFVENVGNLVCPASFDLGVHRNVTLLSVPEGDDKPAKYPVMFRGSDLALITKVDLLPHLEEFSVERARQSLRQVGFAGSIIELSKRGGDGFAAWLAWLRGEVASRRAVAA
jgi:hydrogenase nickel incorporation protein HypB